MKITASIPTRLNITVETEDGEISPQAIRHALIMAAEAMTNDQLVDLFASADDVDDVDETDDGNAQEDHWHREECEVDT